MTHDTLTITIPADARARRAWVTFRLHSIGESFTSLATREGVSPQSLSNAMVTPSSHLERVIARAVGVTIRELFPERFDAGGRRLFRTRHPNRSTRVESPARRKAHG